MSQSNRLNLITHLSLFGLIFVALFFPDLALAQSTPVNCVAREVNATLFVDLYCTSGLKQTWWAVLALTDFLVVGGLIAAAYGNIFHLKIDSYELKKMLPGLVIGVILANLSYFIMQFLIETATMSVDFIATLIKSFMAADPTVGSQTGFSFLLKQGVSETLKSLWVTAYTGDSGVQSVASVASDVTKAIGGTGIGVIALFLIPLIGLLLLITIGFLLYVRVYVLAILFILSPVAFFAAGVPAFKPWFDKFWGMLSQWLIMAPLMAIVYGLGAIYFQNISSSSATDPASHKNVLDYVFYNGIGLVIFYYAIRLPFIISAKAPIFGQDVMKKWSDAGRYVGKEGSKGAWDLGGKGLAKLKNRNSKLNDFLADPKEREKRKKIALAMPRHQQYTDSKGVVHAQEGAIEYKERIAREYMNQRRASAAETYATYNPWRQGVGIGQVYQNFRKERQTADEILTKRAPVPNSLSQKYTPATFAAEQTKRFQEEFKENENITELFDKFNKIHTAATGAGYTPAQATEIARAALNTTRFHKLLESDKYPELIKKINLQDLTESGVAGQRLRQVYQRRRLPGRGGIDAINDMIGADPLRPVPAARPYAPGSRPGSGAAQPPAATAGVVAPAPVIGAPPKASAVAASVQAVAAPVPSVVSTSASSSVAPSGQSALDVEKGNLTAKRAKDNNVAENDSRGELVQAVSNLGEQVGQMAGETAAIASRSAATAATPSINVQVNTGAGQGDATAPSVEASTPVGTPIATTTSSSQDSTQAEEPSASSTSSTPSGTTNQPVQGINVTPASPSIENIVVPTPIGKPINSSDVRSAQSGTFDPEAPQA